MLLKIDVELLKKPGSLLMDNHSPEYLKLSVESSKNSIEAVVRLRRDIFRHTRNLVPYIK
jgi:hypothetical protein